MTCRLQERRSVGMRSPLWPVKCPQEHLFKHATARCILPLRQTGLKCRTDSKSLRTCSYFLTPGRRVIWPYSPDPIDARSGRSAPLD
jgi:hypothetical protein